LAGEREKTTELLFNCRLLAETEPFSVLPLLKAIVLRGAKIRA
jgi:hypothetical protein